jgi:hypothetical protein
MRDFMACHSIQLDVAKAKLVLLSREHDCYLMDNFRFLPNFTDDNLYDINCTCIFLKVTTLSDISDDSGTFITDNAFAAMTLSDRVSPL